MPFVVVVKSHVSPLLSLVILLVLGAILVASALTFTVLARRWTTQRRRVAMGEWGRQRGFRLEMAADVRSFGPPLDVLAKYAPQPAVCLDDGRTRLLAVVSDAPARGASQIGAQDPTNADVLEYRDRTSPGKPGAAQVTWRLLLRRIEPTLQTAGLRPTHDRHSFLDLISLSSFPGGGGNDRFLLFAADAEGAREFPAHAIASLTPQDVGVLVINDALVLDFSSRPFDDLEFNRMNALADQLARKLTKPG